MGRLSNLRFLLGLLVAGLSLTFVCAALLVAGHWAQGALTHDIYDFAFNIHAAPSLLLLPALVLFLSEFGEPPRAWRPTWVLPVAIGSFGVAALATIALLWDPGAAQSLRSFWLRLALWLPCLLVAALVFPRLTEKPRLSNIVLVLTSFVQLAGIGLSVPFGQPSALSALVDPSVFGSARVFLGWAQEMTTLAAVVAALGESNEQRLPVWPVAVLALAPISPGIPLLQLPVSFSVLASAGWLLATALRQRRTPRGLGEFLFASLAALVLLESASFGQMLRLVSADIHLHDTYFVTGVAHLQASACVLAALAVAHRHQAAPGRKSQIFVAGALSAVGSQLMGIAMLFVGARGMPRRYWNYLPEFQPWHRAIAVGGCLLMLGVIWAVLPLLTRKPVPAAQ